jgi:hypothetical protein
MQSVAAAARDRIVKRKLEIIIAKKPVEGRPGLAVPALVASYTERFKARRYGASSLDGLLIEPGFLPFW